MRSNLSPDISSPVWWFPWFSPVSAGKCLKLGHNPFCILSHSLFMNHISTLSYWNCHEINHRQINCKVYSLLIKVHTQIAVKKFLNFMGLEDSLLCLQNPVTESYHELLCLPLFLITLLTSESKVHLNNI